MKKPLLASLISFLTFMMVNCKKTDTDPPSPVSACKLTEIDRGNGNKHLYEYNSAGYVSKMTIEYQGSASGGKKEVYVYSFTYNNSNQIAEASITVDGQKPTEITGWGIGDAVRFTWTNGQLTQVIDQLAGKPLVTTTVSYDAQGRITHLKAATDPNWGAPFRKEFIFDATGNSKMNLYDDGKLFYTEVATFDPATRSAESLMPAHGLPLDVFNLMPWRINSTQALDGYSIDSNGAAILKSIIKRVKLEKNSAGLATTVILDDNGKQRVMQFKLSDCP